MDKVEKIIKAVRGPSVKEMYLDDIYNTDSSGHIDSNDLQFRMELYMKLSEDEKKWDSSSSIITEIFTNGNCGNFALFLKELFPSARFFEDTEKNHIITLIDKDYYDITGKVTKEYLNSELVEKSEKELFFDDYVDNYSFLKRGPLI